MPGRGSRSAPASAARPQRAPGPSAARNGRYAGAGECVCVYAVVSGATGSIRASGASGERLRRIRVGGLDLVIGIVPRVPRPTAAAMRRYDATVRHLMQVHGSVLPARFGSCAATLDALTSSTRDRRDALRRALRRVRHRVQMTVRVFAGQTGVRTGSDQGQTGVRPGSEYEYGPTQGRHYLQRRAAELQIPGTEPLRTAVRKWVRAERSERHERGRLVGSLYHLVPRGAAAAYCDALRRAALKAGVTIVISGPWPPYAFAEGEW